MRLFIASFATLLYLASATQASAESPYAKCKAYRANPALYKACLNRQQIKQPSRGTKYYLGVPKDRRDGKSRKIRK